MFVKDVSVLRAIMAGSIAYKGGVSLTGRGKSNSTSFDISNLQHMVIQFLPLVLVPLAALGAPHPRAPQDIRLVWSHQKASENVPDKVAMKVMKSGLVCSSRRGGLQHNQYWQFCQHAIVYGR